MHAGGMHGGYGGHTGGYYGHYGHYGYYGHRFGYGYGYGYGYWGWPVYWGSWDGSYDYGYAPGVQEYSPSPNITVVYPQPAQTAPVVIETARPVMHEYNQPADYGLPPPQENRPVLYLIAFKDRTIRAAMTYWTDGGTLHYLDTDHKEKQAPLDSVDRDFSAQLNRERHVQFRLPQ